jgi:iron(III) transport system substrate-binding protein
MKKIILIILTLSFFKSIALANEVNVFSARHYDADIQLYDKFTSQTGIKVNVISGKDKSLQKRIIEEGKDSKADLYITAEGCFKTLCRQQLNLQYRQTLDLKIGQE